MDIGQKIRYLRTKNGHTLEELGNKLNFNFSNLSKIERGTRKPTLELLEDIAKIYDVPVSFFFGETKELPNELKKHGEGWINFIEEMEQKELTPEQIKATLELLEKLGKI
ncbi:helix-turn-helix domain-containing protein [Mesobacillus subterraneus]|uniref:helix-turn-helix domain-containing protein n=1 Tax=Mesobacillus subterraneus TaxID=285983 RepID=UPI00203BF8D9|nr:helix-turn-helix transcriptional regulator [Mesobacillus subterraneus]MCM3665552.1 helix-turn-helix domain-containing protein [Mesobacillus subterraneus]MCM3686111.1 helix-turn-helix domain-containing protein [Mesobacillus subterraneus]